MVTKLPRNKKYKIIVVFFQVVIDTRYNNESRKLFDSFTIYSIHGINRIYLTDESNHFKKSKIKTFLQIKFLLDSYFFLK